MSTRKPQPPKPTTRSAPMTAKSVNLISPKNKNVFIPRKSTTIKTPNDHRYDHLDMAAREIMDLLNSARIKHSFIGGYAASLIGSERVTQDVDVLVERECKNLLLAHSKFEPTLDNRVMYKYRDKTVCIDLHLAGSNMGPMFFFPELTQCNTFIFLGEHLRHRPVLNLKSLSVPFLNHEWLVCSKLVPWYAAHIATRGESSTRTETDLVDIKAILEVLIERNIIFDWAGLLEARKANLLRLFGAAYRHKRDLGLLIAQVLSPDDLGFALVESKKFDQGKYLLV
ncbi:hypothetical protein N7456_000956 [Penicillium angulare]|uniref:Uncharacterized protein n=1 Tax=Penicillium angulare TaxID=116970 RepID=A0A9W9GD03_9EURO|nr:hypothetical protein N7456_000956 [Penicillium angulare]